MTTSQLEDITAKTHIQFPRPLTEEETHKLLHYLGGELDADMSYKFESFESVLGAVSEKRPVEVQKGSFTVSGSIRPRVVKEGEFASELFIISDYAESFKPAADDSEEEIVPMVKSFNIQPIVDYSIKDHNDADVALWNRTKKTIDKYFTEHPEGA